MKPLPLFFWGLLLGSTVWLAPGVCMAGDYQAGDVITKDELLSPRPPSAQEPRQRVMTDTLTAKITSVRIMADGGGQSEEKDVFVVVLSSTGTESSQAVRL